MSLFKVENEVYIPTDYFKIKCECFSPCDAEPLRTEKCSPFQHHYHIILSARGNKFLLSGSYPSYCCGNRKFLHTTQTKDKNGCVTCPPASTTPGQRHSLMPRNECWDGESWALSTRANNNCYRLWGGPFWKMKSLCVYEGIEKLFKWPNTLKKKFRPTFPSSLKTKVKKIKLIKLGQLRICMASNVTINVSYKIV